MSLPQPHQSPLAHPLANDPSQSANVVRYDSIQGALGGRRVSSQPVPVTYLRHSADSNPPGHMSSSESRYLHSSSSSSHLTQNPHYSYEQQHYSPPSPPSYDTPHFTHNSLPRMRTPHSLSEPSRTPVGQASQGYGVSYIPYAQSQQQHSQQQQYPIPSGLPWSASYSQYPQTPTDSSLSPEHARGDTGPQSSQQSATQYRTSDTSYSTHAEPARPPLLSSGRGVALSDSKGKQREANVLPLSSRFQSLQRPDFLKLTQTYRSILDNANQSSTPPSISNTQPSGLPSADAIDVLYECALEGIRQFRPSDQGEPPPRSPSPPSRPHVPKDDNIPKGSNPKRQRTTDSSAPEVQKCMGCGATSTPEWRRGPLGPRTLCNACGLVYAKLIKKRGRDAAGRTIMEGAAAYAAASAAGTVPDNFVPSYALGSGSVGISSQHHVAQDDDERDGLAFSGGEGDDSEEDSFEELQGHSGRGDHQGRR
ncbi:hypothetical protein BU17DRAFT_91353 [Hysterangium stoloniferum]|nr:hypothetical protein BU17DRAFT_91353 [Hysterangium stoloniferum]